MSNKPIGIFDSGLGGLTAINEVKRLMPDEDLYISEIRPVFLRNTFQGSYKEILDAGLPVFDI
jgi:hypothetical protein